jgi:hypothetical protein
MYYFRGAAIALALSLVIVSPSLAGKRKAPTGSPRVTEVSPLDRVAFAVDGAESSHGADQAMWRPDMTGPEGPMQISQAAASDVGGGDRFDLDQNRQIGRAYLWQLYRRYSNWPDAIAAYNWGIGNLNAWVDAGRPAGGLVPGVAAYLGRVLHDSGLCSDEAATSQRHAAPTTPSCGYAAAWAGVLGNHAFSPGIGSAVFYNRLNQAMRLAMEHAASR